MARRCMGLTNPSVKGKSHWEVLYLTSLDKNSNFTAVNLVLHS